MGKQRHDKDLVQRGQLIAVVSGKEFFYGGWNEVGGWHLIYTADENFHAPANLTIEYLQYECERIYENFYTEEEDW